MAVRLPVGVHYALYMFRTDRKEGSKSGRWRWIISSSLHLLEWNCSVTGGADALTTVRANFVVDPVLSTDVERSISSRDFCIVSLNMWLCGRWPLIKIKHCLNVLKSHSNRVEKERNNLGYTVVVTIDATQKSHVFKFKIHYFRVYFISWLHQLHY